MEAFIALTAFQRQLMIDAGLPGDRVHVKPNFYPGNPHVIPWTDRGDYVLFAGRLTPEKGVDVLVRAWLEWGDQAPELRMVGDGPLRRQLEGLVASVSTQRIRFFGQASSSIAQRQIAESKLLILPSLSFEGFPMVVREAFAFGTPVAVSNIGPLPSIIRRGVSGVVFAPGNAQSLLREVRQSWETPGILERLSAGARAAFEKSYTEDENYHTLMEIYAAAITIKNERARK